jgi:hypothetical protein
LPDDRVVAAGRFGIGPAIFVLTPDGEMDAGVGTNGRLIYDPLVDTVTPTNPTSHFFRVVLSPDGTRIAATTSNHASGVLLALLRVGEE